MPAHVKAALMGPSLILPLREAVRARHLAGHLPGEHRDRGGARSGSSRPPGPRRMALPGRAPTIGAVTYSIIAFDPDTRECGVAVQSHWFSVGGLVTWAEPGIGAVATQAVVEPAYGPRGLERMRAGRTAPEALAELIAADALGSARQVAMVDAHGGIAAHTGSDCMPFAGQEVGHHHSCQANLMRDRGVWGAMSEAYLGARGPLAERLLDALDAGEAAGGDLRGRPVGGDPRRRGGGRAVAAGRSTCGSRTTRTRSASCAASRGWAAATS